MDPITTTPFGQRPISAVLMQQLAAAQASQTLVEQEKWPLFDDLCSAKADFSLTDRTLSVLHALLSVYPDTVLREGPKLVVFPSNALLAQRLHGMAESTLRRHLATLVTAGLLQRHDSPNGKRFVRRDATGQVLRAFGFSLRPLLEQSAEIRARAERTRAREHALHLLREEVVLLRRDAEKLLDYAMEHTRLTDSDDIADGLLLMKRALRRKPVAADLEAAREQLKTFVDRLRLHITKTEVLPANDAQNERHVSESKTESIDLEPDASTQMEQVDTPLPLSIVIQACPDILPYADTPIRQWTDLTRVAETLRPMLGITSSAWQHAIAVMGMEKAALCIAGIMQRMSAIRSPGGYLRALTTKAERGAFSPTPMILGLLKA